MKKVPISGGPPATVLVMDGSARGATWLPDDTIVFATNNGVTGLQRVSALGGKVTVLTRPDHDRGEADHVWPERLPGGRAVLFTILPAHGGLDAAQVAVLDVTTGMHRVLFHGGTHAQYVPSGHLIYAAAGTLRAIPFDLDRLTVRGRSTAVLPRALTTTQGAADVDVSANGTLAYVEAASGWAPGSNALVWVDRQGREEPLMAPPRGYTQVRLSPDGTRVALYVAGGELDLWIWDITRATLIRLTTGAGQNVYPVWTRDSRRIIFTSSRTGVENLFWQAADGSRAAEQLSRSPFKQDATSLTPDGTHVIVEEASQTGAFHLSLLPIGSGRLTALLNTPSNSIRGAVSPDGHWLAYDSDSSGQSEVYVRPFPNVDAGQGQVSTAGGAQPLWSHSGRELFFIGPDGSIFAVSVGPRSGSWNAGVPTKIVEHRYMTGPGSNGRNYDVSLDDQRFLLIRQAGAAPGAPPPQIMVVQNWQEELKERAEKK